MVEKMAGESLAEGSEHYKAWGVPVP